MKQGASGSGRGLQQDAALLLSSPAVARSRSQPTLSFSAHRTGRSFSNVAGVVVFSAVTVSSHLKSNLRAAFSSDRRFI